MTPIYHFYTLWVIFLSLFEKFTKISMFPSLIIAFVVSFLLAIKYQLSLQLMLINIAIHGLPFLWSKFNVTISIIIANAAIGLLYFTFMQLKKEDIKKLYHTQFQYLQQTKTLPQLIKTHSNICVFC